MELKVKMKLVSEIYTTIGFCRMEISLRLILRISLPMGRGRKKGCGNRSVD